MLSPAREARPAAGPTALAQLARSLAVGSRVLAAGGHDDLNQGQVSGRLPGRRSFLVKAAVRGFCEATPADMVTAEVDPAAPRRPDAPPELPLHQAIYAARPDVNAIVHSHAEWTLVFGMLEDTPLLPVSHDGAWFAGRLARFTDTTQTVLSSEVGSAVAAALGDRPGVLLANHGAVVVGRGVRDAVVGACVLERACRLHLRALSSGRPFRASPALEVPEKRAYVYSAPAVRSYWDFSVRQVAAASAEVRSWL
jgi:L-fuculose-phosphate aldolase